MVAKIKQLRVKIDGLIEQVQDVRVVGLVVFGVIVVLITWSGANAIETNYGLQRQISQLDQQNNVSALANANLQLQNEYFNTSQYLELAARQNFGLIKPGETELLVPRSVALAHTAAVSNDEQQQAATTKAKQSKYQRNFQAWINFFLHRQSSESE